MSRIGDRYKASTGDHWVIYEYIDEGCTVMILDAYPTVTTKIHIWHSKDSNFNNLYNILNGN